MRDAVDWTPGLTLVDLAEEALRETLERLQSQRGGAYPRRPKALKRGRPIKG